MPRFDSSVGRTSQQSGSATGTGRTPCILRMETNNGDVDFEAKSNALLKGRSVNRRGRLKCVRTDLSNDDTALFLTDAQVAAARQAYMIENELTTVKDCTDASNVAADLINRRGFKLVLSKSQTLVVLLHYHLRGQE